MALLSLAVVLTILSSTKLLISSAPCARMLSFFGVLFNGLTNQFSAHSTSCARALSLLGILVTTIAIPASVLFTSTPDTAVAATSNQLNFQGRLLSPTGTLVPDGIYNMEFNLYYVSAGGSTQWTEDRLVTNTQGVTVQNGYFSVYLGEYDAFPAINWSEDLYLGMTIRGTTSCVWGSCAPTDSEMSPRFKLTAVPYAFRASNVASSNTNSASTNSDAITITTGSALGATSSSGNITINTGSGTTASGNISIDVGNGTGSDGTISLGSANASALTLGRTGLTTTNSGALTVTQLTTLNGGLTVETGDTFTFNGDAFTDLTGTGLTISTGALTLDTTTASGAFINGGNAFTASSSLGNTGNYDLNIETNNTTRLTVEADGDVVLAAGKSLQVVGGNTASRPGSPTEGMVYFDTTTKQLLTYANGKWQADRSTATKIVAASNSSQAVKDSADYVADGTGDQTEINAALTAASGGKVYLAEGTYVASATILIPNNTTLAGAGRGTLIELADLDATDNLIENTDQTTGTGVTIRDIRIDGRDDLNTAGTQEGIYLLNMGGGTGPTARQGAKITNVIANNFRTDGVYLESSSNSTLSGNTFQGNFFGLSVYLGAYNTVTNNIAQGNSQLGFYIGTNNNTFTNNVAQGGETGFYTEQAVSNTITGNTTEGNSYVGYYVDDLSSNNVFTGNTSNTDEDYGFYIIGASTYNSFIGNSVRNSINGFRLENASNNNLISANKIHDSGGATTNNGIYLDASDNNTITGNDISDTGCSTNCYAINIFNSTSDNNYLEGNTFTTSSGTATINDSGTGTRYAGQTTAQNGLDVLFKQSNSTTAFRIQDSTGGNAFTVNTTTLGISTGGTLAVTGNTTLTGDLAVNGNDITTGAGDLTITPAGGDTIVTGTLAVTTLGSADTNTFICRNSSNQLATCSSTPLTNSLTDNITDAFDLQEGTNNYFNINTTNTTENISFGNATTNPSYNFLGSGTLAVAGSQTIAGNLDTAGTIFAGTGDAFQVSSAGAVTAVGVNSGAGLLQGQLGLTVTGATTNINASSNFGTNINTGTSTGTLAIGNSLSTTNILGATNINTSGSTTTTIGGATSALNLSGATSVTGSNTLTVGTGLTSLGGGLSVTAGNTTLTADLTVNGNTTIGNATTDRLTVTSYILGQNALVFEGATDGNGFATTFAITDPTANNTITFPDASGTVTLNPASGSYLLQVPTSTAANTVTPTANSVVGLTVNATSGTAATATIVNQTQAADGVNINTTNGAGTQTNGLLVARNGAGTTTNLLNLTNTSGTATNAINISGTFTNLISSTNLTVTNAGNADFAGTLTAGTADAFQVSSAGAVTAVGVNSGAGLLQGQLGLTVTGATTNINASSNFGTNINTGTSTGAVAIGNSLAGAITLQSASTIGLTGTSTVTGLSAGAGTALTVNNSTSTGSIFVAQDNGTPVFTIADGGAITATQLVTLNGGLTVETGDTFTFNGDGFTDFTGGGLINSAGVLSIDTTSATGFFQNGGNTFTANATLGINANYDLNIETNSLTRLTVQADGDLAVDTNTLFVDATLNQVGIGTVTTGTSALTVAGASSLSTASALSVTNSSSANLLQVRNDGLVDIGINRSVGGTVMGNTTAGSTEDNSEWNSITAVRFTTAGATMNVTSMSVYVESVNSAPDNKYQVGIYTNGNTLVANSAEGTLVANSWNTIAITATLTASTTYKLAYMTNGSNNGNNNMMYTPSATATEYTINTYGSWPGSLGGLSAASSGDYSIYATAGNGGSALRVDQNGKVGINVQNITRAFEVLGDSSFTSAVDSTSAFAIKNAAGTSLFNLDSTNSTSTFTGTSTTANVLNVTSVNTTAGSALSITANALTTGDALNISSTGTGLTTGSLLRVSTATTGAIATDGAVSIQATGNYTSTSGIGLLSVLANTTQAGTVANIQANALTTGDALNISSTGTGLTTGSLLRVSTATTGAIATDGAVSIQATGNYTSTSGIGLLSVLANTTQAGTVANIQANALTTGDALNISSTGTGLTTGSLLRVSTATTGAIATDGAVSIQATGNYTSTSGIGLLSVLANTTQAGTVANIQANALTTGDALNISSTGTGLTTGSLLRVSTATTGAIATDGAVSIQATGNYTSTTNVGLLSIQANTTQAGTIQNIQGNALTTGQALYISSSGTGLTTGSLFYGTSATTGAVATNGIFSLNATGNYTSTSNTGLLNVVANATTAGTITNIQGNALTTGTALNVSSTGVLTTTGNLLTLTANSATTATGVLTVNATALTTGAGITVNAGTATAISAGGNITFQELTGTRTLGVQTRTTNVAGTALTVQAGQGGTTSAGGTLTLQGGSGGATSGAGGDIMLVGGTATSGNKGLVVVDTATFKAATVQNFTANANITQANIDAYGSILISGNVAGWVATMTDPSVTTAGRVIYVTNSGTVDMTLSANTVGVALSITLKPASTATMYWNGTDWTAAGASSSTDLQAAYDNTATSAGGAEIVLSSTGTGGLTIRNDDGTAITGGLLEVQSSIGSNLFTVNNNSTEYANNGGAENSTFTMWTAAPTAGGTISRYTTVGDNIATGAGSVFVDSSSTANTGVRNTLTSTLTRNLKYRVSFAIRHTSSSTAFSTLDVRYSPSGSNTDVEDCSTSNTVNYGQWTRITCTFIYDNGTTPTSSNAILITHSDATDHDYYIDNFSTTVSADVNHAIDGSVDLALGTNWVAIGGSVARSTSVLYDTSGSVAATTTAVATRGVYNNLTAGIVPQVSTQYRVAFYARGDGTNTATLAVAYTPDNNSTSVSCTDYSTQVVSATAYTLVTCLLTTSATTPVTAQQLRITQTAGSATIFYVDALTMTLNTNNANNVQIGGANKGGPVTLFTLDRSAGAPIAANNDAYLGSMYYDTITGRIQCYEADGWGACGAAPDNIVNLNPEYAGAVLHGDGVGTMTADFCSDDTALAVNASLCDTGEAKNFYKWTSPQATPQTYSIFVTYQLPATFNGFSNDDTVQLTARVDSTTNADVTYEMFKSTGSAVTQCGTGETDVIAGGGNTADVWHTYGVNGNEATGCSFNSSSAGNFVIFKINMKANSGANAYVSTLNFVTTGR
jgi:parallel beta-helix repeat protein